MPKDVSTQEKESALKSLLAYHGIAESPTLQHFLEFVGHKAIQGETQHLKEYLIATQVFNKAKDFDPRLDPMVRVHARRLREKLEEYYAGPGGAAPVRVVIAKGTYLPQFVRRRSDWRVPASLWPWLSLVLVLTLAAQFWTSRRAVPSPGAGIQSAPASSGGLLLRPLLESPHRTVVAFSNDVFLKDRDGNMFRLKPDEKLELGDWMQRNPQDLLLSRSLRGREPLYFDADYTGTGEAVCISLLTRLFTQRGKTLEVKASSLFSARDLRDGNVIFLGSPRENIILGKMVMALDFRFVRRDNPAGRPFLAIENLRPAAGEKALYEARLHPASKNPQEVYALVSFLPGMASGSHFLVLAGQSTAGTQSVCEYVLDPAVERELPAALTGRAPSPSSYQVLLKTAVRDAAPFRTEYVTSHVGEAANRPGVASPAQ